MIHGLVRATENPRQSATFLRQSGQDLIFQVGTEEKKYRSAADMALFRAESPAVQVQRLVLLGAERVELVLNQSGEVGVLLVEPLEGAGSDRISRYYRWDVRMSLDELQKRLSRNCAFGRLLDLEVIRTGESQRVTELLVKGTEGNVLLRGIRIRWALGLRDNLFVIDLLHRDRDREAVGANRRRSGQRRSVVRNIALFRVDTDADEENLLARRHETVVEGRRFS